MKQFVLVLIIRVFILDHYFEMNINLKLGKRKKKRPFFEEKYVYFSWHTITSITSNKQRQITLSYKNGSTSRHSLIYYTDSTNYNRYCLRLLNVFYEYFSKYPPNENEYKISKLKINSFE